MRLFSDEAKKINNQFNIAWSGLINELHNAFNGETPSLEKSIELRFRLKKPAFALCKSRLREKAGMQEQLLVS